MRALHVIAVCAGLLAGAEANAQFLPEFKMRDTTVTICKGILHDSELGPNEAIYSNNEDLTFVIDAGGPITLTFEPTFCLEQGLDILTFHDGPSINSPQIGPAYSGIVAPPPITANSGYLTVHFVSDESVAYCGWDAQWTSTPPPPVPPVMNVPTAPLCTSVSVQLRFSYPLPCDSFFLDAFSVASASDPQVVAVSPVNCSGGETNAVDLAIDPPFDRNCPYTITYRCRLPDRCDSLWTFTLNTVTQVTTCPIGVTIEATEDTLCAGSCSQLTAVVNGCNGYTYVWSNGLPPSAGPHDVCPTTTTAYTVTVTEVGTGQQASMTQQIVVFDPSISSAPASICQSAAAFDLVGTPPGGRWTGEGIIDSLAGTFDPDTAGPGDHFVTYRLVHGCADSVLIHVEEMDAGVDEAACPGTDPFYLGGFAPAGGTWSGPFVQSDGLFDPSTLGSYVVTYAAGNCTDTKTVNVNVIAGPVVNDTVCQSERPFDIPVSPFGGIWSGPGIVDTLNGTFDPNVAEGGTHTVRYTLHGCFDEFQIHVKPVDIGDDRSACPSQNAAALVPAAIPPGGSWSGLGITDPAAGIYAPNVAGGGGEIYDVVTYAALNGCVDTIGIDVRWTRIDQDTLFFCRSDEDHPLTEAMVGSVPEGGSWTGPGVVEVDPGEFIFRPGVAGEGVFTITYSNNTCSDELVMIVHPTVLNVPDFTVCDLTGPFIIASVPPGATFSGEGIVDPVSGAFDPATAGAGTHTVWYATPAGCTDSVVVTVYAYAEASITGVEEVYCSNAGQVTIGLVPDDGTFTGLPQTLFEPSQLAPGAYTLIYTAGAGACLSSDTVHFVNHAPLVTELTVSNNPICGGGGSQLAVIASGGAPGAMITYQWDHGLFPVSDQSVAPEVTTSYTVMTTDGCSDPRIDSVTIAVYPVFHPTFGFSELQCYGEPGHVQGTVDTPGDYTFAWDVDPPVTGAWLDASAGESVVVTVTNDQSGCAVDTLLQVPSWPALTALFSVSPNEPCIAYEDREVTFIDLSNHADSGYWIIDDAIVPYVFGTDPEVELGGAGAHSASLTVFNGIGCVDSFALEVCVLPSTDIFIPDIFSPNGDGNNDELFVRGGGISTMDFRIYDRWGGVVFSADRNDRGWDGTNANGAAPSGVYIYVLRAEMLSGVVVELNGDITLVR